ncbi:dynein axonemal assembly factor 8 [Rhinoraja longicauda]
MTSNDNRKPGQVDESRSELRRTNDSLTTAHDGYKSYWDMIFAHVKDELPSLDSDFSSSGSEDGEVAIFQRGTTGLISSLPEDLKDISLEDPVLEEMLESARCPSEAWATENKGRNSDRHEGFWGETTWHLKKSSGINKRAKGKPGSFSGDNPTDSTSSVGLIMDKSSLPSETESTPDTKEHLTDLRNNGGGDPHSSQRQKVINSKEEKSLKCRASGDGNSDCWCLPAPAITELSESTTTKDFVKNVSGSTSQSILDTETPLEKQQMNYSENQEQKQISKEKLSRGEPSGCHAHKPPILSLESLEEVDLDEILRSLQQVEVHGSDVKDHGPCLEHLVNSSWSGSVHSRVNSEKNLMEQLTLLCTKQSGGAATLNNQASTCTGEHQPKREPRTRSVGTTTNDLNKLLSPEAGSHSVDVGRMLPMKQAREPKTVFIDLRSKEQERTSSKTSCRNGKMRLVYLQDESSTESSLEEDNRNTISVQSSAQGPKKESWQDSGDCTGKSMLLRQLRKGSVNSLKVPGDDSRCVSEQAVRKDVETRAVQRKKRKARSESRKPVSKPEEVAVTGDSSVERGGLDVLSPHSDQLISKPAPTVEKCASRVTAPATTQSPAELARREHRPANGNSQSPEATDHQPRERQSRQRLQRQLDSLRPLRSVTGRQRSAEGTPLLFNTEASYLPRIRTLPEKETTDALLLVLHLSSCGMLLTSEQNAAPSLVSAGTSANLYNALVLWLLSLVPTQPPPADGLHRKGVEVDAKAPFQVVGLQQAWHEDGLALYACVVPKCQSFSGGKATFSKNWRNKVKEEVRATSLFYQLVISFLSQTSVRSVIWWIKELNDSLQGLKFPPCVLLPTTHLSSMVSVNPDSKAAQRIFDAEIGFYWQTFETEDSCCPTAAENGESCVEKPEVTMALVFETLFTKPIALHHTLQLVLSCGLDICGLQLLYPSRQLLAASAGRLPSAYSCDDTSARCVLALALRGVNAGTLWTDIVGPSDPRLATVTDQHSINALYCEHREEPLLYSPHQESRIQWELCVWFGGRIPENGIVQVGIQNPGKKSSLKCRSNAAGCTDTRDNCRPPATLVATITADIFLLVSPVVPPRYYGDIISVCTRRGFILQGMRRLRLSAKRAESLGIASVQIPVFCRTGCFGPLNSHRPAPGSPTTEMPYPCFMMLLRKENAIHQVASLLKGLVNELAEQGSVRDVLSRLPPEAEFEITTCFHVAPYTDQTLQGLGGAFSAMPQPAHLTLDVLYKHSFVSSPELEQVVVLTLTGRSARESAGSCLRGLLRPAPNKSPRPAGDVEVNRGFELLGLKWLPHLSRSQAKELTPFEVGDRHWQESIDCLVSSPALVCVLRRVDAFTALTEMLAAAKGRASVMQENIVSLERVMSPTPELVFRQAALFFTDQELISDPSARPLLNYLSPSLRSGITTAGDEAKTVNMESIFSYMLLGPQPLLTLLIIKPSVWSHHLPKILRKLDLEHFCVVGLKLVTLDAETASLLTPRSIQQDPALVKSSIDSLVSAPSVILCVERDNAVKKLLDLLGPEDPQQARDLDQFLLRAHWGTDLVHNGFYGSSSFANAVRDVKACFPEGVCCEESPMMKAEKIGTNIKDQLVSPEVPPRRKLVKSSHWHYKAPDGNRQQGLLLPTALRQTMCLLLAPPLIAKCHHPPYIEVLDQLGGCGFQVVGARMGVLDQSQAQHVTEILSTDISVATCSLLTSGPCLMLALERDNGVCCFGTLLNSLNWDKLELQDRLQHFLYPKTELQVERLLSCLFDTLAPESIHQVVLQDCAPAPGTGTSLPRLQPAIPAPPTVAPVLNSTAV